MVAERLEGYERMMTRGAGEPQIEKIQIVVSNSSSVVNKTVNTLRMAVIARIPDPSRLQQSCLSWLEPGTSCPVVLSVDNCGGGGRCFG